MHRSVVAAIRGGFDGHLFVHPVVLPVVRIAGLDHQIARDLAALVGHGHPGSLAGGHVHVQRDALRQPLREHSLGQGRGNAGRRTEVYGGPLVYRDGHGGDAVLRALGGRGDRAGIVDVLAEVGAGVDAGDDQGRSLLEQQRERHHHAVGRGAVDAEAALALALVAQRAAQRNAPTGGALLHQRGDCADPSDRRQGAFQRADPWRVDPVIVGDQDERIGAGHALPA